MPPASILTIGHSTRPLETFLELLKAHEVERLVDVRTVPRSRRNPQFNKESLPESLAAAGIKYVHMPGLGGLRHARRDSVNTGWRNASFRGYADYMQTPEFEENLGKLLELAGRRRLAIMCAEALPWRCHRSLVADALTVRGVQVEHIMSATRRSPHTLTPWARVEGMRITYPPESLPLGFKSNKQEARGGVVSARFPIPRSRHDGYDWAQRRGGGYPGVGIHGFSRVARVAGSSPSQPDRIPQSPFRFDELGVGLFSI